MQRRPIAFSGSLGSLVLLATLTGPTGAVAATPSFSGNARTTSRNGAALLEWESEGARETFEVERSSSPEFSRSKVVYRGAFASAHVSGLPEGIHHFRVRAAGDGESGWSTAKIVDVQYHPMQLVWSLFALGGLVVTATVAAVIRGAKEAE